MASKRTFGKKSTPSASNNSVLSIRFNKHDEELEVYPAKEIKEASYLPSTSKTESDIFSNAHVSTEDKKNIVEVRQDLLVISKTPIKSNLESFTDEIAPLSKEKSTAKNPAKLSRQAYSLDFESGNVAENDSWNFLKDIGGKLVKNIEECMHKDIVKGDVMEGEIINLNEDSPINDKLSECSTEQADVEHISPSIEATESFEENFPSDCHVEIIKSTPQEASKNHFNTSQKKKKGSPKTEFNMKLSSLMASRSFSFTLEDNSKSKDKQEAETSENNRPEKSPVSTPVDSSHSSSSSWSFCKIMKNPFQLCWNIMPWKMNLIIAFIAFCFRFMMPSFLFWFLFGAIISALVTYWLTRPPAKKPKFKLPNYKSLPSLAIPESDATLDTSVFKGWMNVLPLEYNPDTYHVSSTHSVYLRLDGSSLRVSYPKVNIPKRAMYNEKRHELASLFPRHHDITGASVELLPKGLPKKRLWSKKYPICLKFTDPQQSLSFSSKDPLSKSCIAKSQGSKESSPSKKYEPKINEQGEFVMYLFARTDREKDDWYRRFLKASRIKMLKSHSPISSPNIASLETTAPVSRRPVSVDLGSLQTSASMSCLPTLEDNEVGDDEAFDEIEFDKQQKFEFYMSQLLKSSSDSTSSKKRAPFKERNESPSPKTQPTQDLVWLNTLLGRLSFDFFTEDTWTQLISEKIQRKLSKIRLPNFIEELKIRDLNLGSILPKIHRTSAPSVDHRGLWVDIDISYNGHFQMTLETKLNLFKLKKSEGLFSSYTKEKELEEVTSKEPHEYDSDEEDSAESSSDEDVPMPELKLSTSFEENPISPAASGGGSTGKKLIRLVDKIAQSAYFQSATKNKFVQRAMTEVSNTPLVLTVEIHWLTGTLALNIPPMPTDRLWYGFRKNPELCIEARPKLGCRAVKVSHITEWIEQKLVLEFQKVLVMPNMDDLYIPIMHSDLQFSP